MNEELVEYYRQRAANPTPVPKWITWWLIYYSNISIPMFFINRVALKL